MAVAAVAHHDNVANAGNAAAARRASRRAMDSYRFIACSI
ncbi:hypothetical protein C7S16_4910 [Burkholderia thailandensis]|uniref:Uncharacterized protein n=1 Tax=Burkholderia thailandensis TaxID=57975 RepID=A0AAW9CZ05_BURTH|nr:hypothetical protein [Burkholderia thailandensis]MDW9252984.1 hypothetical protein [Burkholderia thailandensis]